MNDDADEALVKYAGEVMHLIDLYRAAQETLSVDSLTAFNLQFLLVETLTRVALLPVIRVPAGKVGQ